MGGVRAHIYFIAMYHYEPFLVAKGCWKLGTYKKNVGNDIQNIRKYLFR